MNMPFFRIFLIKINKLQIELRSFKFVGQNIGTACVALTTVYYFTRQSMNNVHKHLAKLFPNILPDAQDCLQGSDNKLQN